jgi:hypothetical protein
MVEIETAPVISIVLPPQATQDEEIAAAIAAALTYARRLLPCRDGLGTALEAGAGAWWALGHAQRLSVNGWHTQRRNHR